MKLIKNEQIEKNVVKLTIEVDKEAFEKAIEKANKNVNRALIGGALSLGANIEIIGIPFRWTISSMFFVAFFEQQDKNPKDIAQIKTTLKYFPKDFISSPLTSLRKIIYRKIDLSNFFTKWSEKKTHTRFGAQEKSI